MFLRISTIAVVVLGLGAGCVNGDVDEPQSEGIQHDFIGGGGCDVFMCGTNSPQIAEFGFWDLNVPTTLGILGQPNIRGMQVLGFLQNNAWYLPRVFAGRLTAVRSSTVLAGQALVGGYLYLLNGNRAFAIRVTEVGSVASWAQPSSGSPHITLESYKLDWSELVNGVPERFQNMCNNPPAVEKIDDTLGMTGKLAFHTLLFEGDRIDATKKLDTGVDTSWFNLGCAGSALAKMALTGHTEAARDARAFVTSLSERQTMLKMLTADYCGDGTPFTVAGQPLNWMDDRGTMKLLQQPQQLAFEARWKDGGPACLDKPRVDIHPTTLSNTTFGLGVNIYDLVKNTCPSLMPKQCSDENLDTEGYHLLSATPL